MTEPEIDRADIAIDRAVRDVMNVDADGAFRARVTVRIERSGSRGTAPRMYAVAAAAAAVILAIVWARMPGVVDGPAPAPSISATVAPRETGEPVARAGGPDEVAKTATAPAAAPAAPRRAARLDPIPRGAIVATVVEAPPEIPPLQALESITVDPIAQISIAPAAIVVAPLPPIAEVQIAPLEPRTERQ